MMKSNMFEAIQATPIRDFMVGINKDIEETVSATTNSSSKRQDYISKDDMYMTMAFIASLRSKDPNTQVGAVIVSDQDRILSVGYNGFPNGISDDEFPWDREAKCEEETKYPYVVHAEANAILNFRGDNRALQGATLYVTLFPCHECTKLVIQSGIKKIIYRSNKYSHTADFREAKKMLDAVGIECVQYNIDHEESVKLCKKVINYFGI